MGLGQASGLRRWRPVEERSQQPRVLVVEDDGPTRQMLVQFLEGQGFRVLAAQDGQHALRVAAAGAPDVIVLDMGLPYLDGSGFALGWQQRQQAVDVPIVGISGLPYGYAMAEQIGVAAFYEKPFDLNELALTLRGLVARRRSQRAPTDRDPNGDD